MSIPEWRELEKGVPNSGYKNHTSLRLILMGGVGVGVERCRQRGVQSCLTLGDPREWRVRGILQARILEWIAIFFSRGSFRPRN